jgi:hypothetical protein
MGAYVGIACEAASGEATLRLAGQAGTSARSFGSEAEGFGGHVRSNGDIRVEGQGRVDGDATPGPGRTVVVRGQGVVTGSTAPAAESLNCSVGDLEALVAWVRANHRNAQIPPTDRGRLPWCGEAGGWDFCLEAGETVHLPAGVYMFTGWHQESGSRVILDGYVRILLMGEMELEGDAGVNPGGSPYDLLVFFVPSEEAEWKVENRAVVRALVYGPGADLRVAGQGRLEGSLMGRRVRAAGRGRLVRWVDGTGPTVTLAPSGGLCQGTGDLSLAFTAGDLETGLDPEGIVVTLDGSDVGASLTAGDAFWREATGTAAVSGAGEGWHRWAVTVRNRVGQTAGAVRDVAVDMTAPTVAITSPADGAVVGTPEVEVRGTAGDNFREPCGLTVTVNGQAVEVGGDGTWATVVSLTPGPNVLEAVATDGVGHRTTARVTVTYQPAERPGRLRGRVVDAATGAPLGGIPVVSELGRTVTDGSGQFTLPIRVGEFWVEARGGDAYTSQARRVRIDRTDLVYDAGVWSLQRLDPQVTRIGPEGGTARDSTGTVEVVFPPGAVAEPIEVRLTALPETALPGPMTAGLAYVQAVDLRPHGVTFAVPVTLRIANRWNLPTGFQVPIGFWDEDQRQWRGEGYATVRGGWLEGSITHFSTMDCNGPVIEPNDGDADPEEPRYCQEGDGEGSIVNAKTGTVCQTVSLGDGLSLAYTSGANKVLFHTYVTRFRDPDVPVTIQVEVGGRRLSTTFHLGQDQCFHRHLIYDCRDAEGRPVVGPVTYTVRVVRRDADLVSSTTWGRGGLPDALRVRFDTPVTVSARQGVVHCGPEGAAVTTHWGLPGTPHVQTGTDGTGSRWIKYAEGHEGIPLVEAPLWVGEVEEVGPIQGPVRDLSAGGEGLYISGVRADLMGTNSGSGAPTGRTDSCWRGLFIASAYGRPPKGTFCGSPEPRRAGTSGSGDTNRRREASKNGHLSSPPSDPPYRRQDPTGLTSYAARRYAS